MGEPKLEPLTPEQRQQQPQLDRSSLQESPRLSPRESRSHGRNLVPKKDGNERTHLPTIRRMARLRPTNHLSDLLRNLELLLHPRPEDEADQEAQPTLLYPPSKPTLFPGVQTQTLLETQKV